MTTAKWQSVPEAYVSDGENPNKSYTHVMTLGNGVLVKVGDWSLGSQSIAMTYVRGVCLADFGIEEEE